MRTNLPNNQENQEIDLSMISAKINGFFDGIYSKIYRTILYFQKNAKIIKLNINHIIFSLDG